MRKPQVLPMLLGKKPPMVLCKKANDYNDWRDIFACNGLLAKGATGMVLSGTLKAQGTPGAFNRILEPEFNEKMVIQFFREFEILKACQHPNIFRPMKCRFRHLSWSCWAKPWTYQRQSRPSTITITASW